MSNFNDAIARMKALYTYGTVNENNNKQTNYTLEFTKKAADGKFYGIVKECNHYYIKQTVEGKQNLAESYDYIGGYMNKKNYQYDSYANALKNLELKLSSINEAQEAKINIETLDPFKKEELVVEGTEAMRNEIARQRQIMYNASMLMNESIGFNNIGTPEAPKGSNNADKPFVNTAKATLDKDLKASAEKPENQSEPFGDGSAPEKGKDVKDSDIYSDGKAVAADHVSGGKVVRVNEDKAMSEDSNLEWGSEGLPADAGVGSPDGHIMEDDENLLNDEEEDDELDDVVDLDDDEDEDEFSEDDINDDDLADDEEDELSDDDDLVDDEEDDINDEEEEDELSDDDDLADDEDDEVEFDINDDEEEDDLSDDFDSDEDEDELDMNDDEGELDMNDDEDDLADDEDEDDLADDFDSDEDEDDEDFLDITESKKRVMSRIVESVVRGFLNEDELHVFGDHPGYRKKPMNLPPTGVDKNEHGEDINDESAHNEEPFGKEIGSSSPFDKLVDAVTNDVKYQLTHGSAFNNKKKVN